MKKLIFTIILLFGVGYFASPAFAQVPSANKNSSSYPVVYANAYDGFINIREAASNRSRVLGRFHNGPEGASLLERTGNWCKISYKGIVGYVYYSYVTSNKTRKVDVDVSSGWLFGEWLDSSGLCNLIIKSDGTFIYGNYVGSGVTFRGTWRLAGEYIIFKTTWKGDPAFPDPIDEARLNGKTKTIVGWKKGHLNTSGLGA